MHVSIAYTSNEPSFQNYIKKYLDTAQQSGWQLTTFDNVEYLPRHLTSQLTPYEQSTRRMGYLANIIAKAL